MGTVMDTVSNRGDGGPGEEHAGPEGPFGWAGPVDDVVRGHVVLGVIDEHIPDDRIHSEGIYAYQERTKYRPS